MRKGDGVRRTDNTPCNEPEVKESRPIPQSLGQLPISRLAFYRTDAGCAPTKHCNVGTQGWSTNSRGSLLAHHLRISCIRSPVSSAILREDTRT